MGKSFEKSFIIREPNHLRRLLFYISTEEGLQRATRLIAPPLKASTPGMCPGKPTSGPMRYTQVRGAQYIPRNNPRGDPCCKKRQCILILQRRNLTARVNSIGRRRAAS